MADDLLEEAFTNLLTDAIQHNDKDVPRVTVDVTTDHEKVTVEMADNGPGIPAAVRHRIFEQGENGFDSAGNGCGLYLVREILKLCDGTVAIE